MDKPELMKKAGDVFSLRKLDYTAVTDSAAEVTMPDYYPEVRRVVAVFAEALPDSKYISDGKLEYGGTVSFCVLYIGDDNSLSCVPYSGEYSDSLKLTLPDGIEGTGSIKIFAGAENVQCRVTAPRKLSLKAKIRSQIIADGKENYICAVRNSSGEPCGTAGLEYLESSKKTVFRKYVTATGNCGGEIPDAAGTKPVMCLGAVCVDSVTAEHDCVTVKGRTEVKCTVLNADGIYSTVTGYLPIEETVNIPGVLEGDIASACGRAASVSVSTDGGMASADVEYDLDVIVCREAEITVTDDIYSTFSGLDAERTDYEPISLIACHNGGFTLSGDIRRTGEKTPDDYIITASADPTFEKAEVKDGRLVLTGNCRVRVYTASCGEVNCDEGIIPMRYETGAAADAAPQEILWSAFASPSKIAAKYAGDTVSVSAELSVSLDAVKKYKISPVTQATLTGDSIRDEGGCVIKVCCPGKGTPIWNIAKEHHASIPELERINSVRRDGVSDGSPIIIK